FFAVVCGRCRIPPIIAPIIRRCSCSLPRRQSSSTLFPYTTLFRSQCLVVNKNTGLPGEGIGWFLVKKEDFATLPLKQKRAIVEAELQHVFSYPRWQEVLKALELEPTISDFTPVVNKASGGFGGGEIEEQKALKAYVAQNPKVIGLGDNTSVGTTEYPLPSGDSLDVSFNSKEIWVAAEVKSS